APFGGAGLAAGAALGAEGFDEGTHATQSTSTSLLSTELRSAALARHGERIAELVHGLHLVDLVIRPVAQPRRQRRRRHQGGGPAPGRGAAPSRRCVFAGYGFGAPAPGRCTRESPPPVGSTSTRPM